MLSCLHQQPSSAVFEDQPSSAVFKTNHHPQQPSSALKGSHPAVARVGGQLWVRHRLVVRFSLNIKYQFIVLRTGIQTYKNNHPVTKKYVKGGRAGCATYIVPLSIFFIGAF